MDGTVGNISLENQYIRADINFDWFNDAVKDSHVWLDQNVLNDTIPYIPYLNGNMLNQIIARNASTAGNGEVVVGTGDYAQYLYNGKVMIETTGQHAFYIQGVGWRHHKGSKLVATSTDLNYTKSPHPLAQKQWDVASMNANNDKWVEGVKNIIWTAIPK